MNRRKKMSMLVVAVATLGATAMTPASPAQADDEQPTTRELLEQCDDGTDLCVFHPSGSPVDSMGDAHQVGDSAFNCTKDLQRSTVGWSDTTGETNTVGVSMSAEYGFTELFKVTITASYEHSWQSSHTEEQQTNVEVKPGQVGWITREAAMEEVDGTYEMHFEDPYYGHRIWYVPFTAKGPKADAPSTKTQHTRKMTKKEKQEHCG
ncbi:hypothetical protein K378_03380 [Streptomyces sp. Amel2xB2]|uniref:DUF4148 domain-containing protein n=1 Tax=Streptomyces sp. Amel2xB2 TaxID=1305829 RepID=UPI000DB9DCA7|nr:DUF4148 domain-containing protein [Streptomyces sp. Amel2xB2]RAJ63269.1 hypothetical protein K378_03380 [Streptomyces sp. Amel2xB2]